MMNQQQMQQSQHLLKGCSGSCAGALQLLRILCCCLQGIRCHYLRGIFPSEVEQNQRLPKPRSVGAICQMCLHPLSKTWHLKHTNCSSSSSFFSPLNNRSCMRGLDCEHFAPYGYASCGRVLGKEYTAEEQEKRLKIDLTRLKDVAAPVTNPPLCRSRVLA